MNFSFDSVQPAEWPAWIQALGSIIAIVAAIWIDRGTTRRAVAREGRARQELVRDWEACLARMGVLAENAARLSQGDPMSDDLDDLMPGRLIDNAIMMADAYLRQMPPTPVLAFTLAAARSHLEIPREAIRIRRTTDPKLFLGSFSTRLHLAGRVRSTTQEAADAVRVLMSQYDHDML